MNFTLIPNRVTGYAEVDRQSWALSVGVQFFRTHTRLHLQVGPAGVVVFLDPKGELP